MMSSFVALPSGRYRETIVSMKKVWIAAPLALWVSCLACAGGKNKSGSVDPTARPGRIHGKIVGLDGEGIDLVTVETDPPTDRVLTTSGRFELKRLVADDRPIPAGRYSVRVTKLGYQVVAGQEDVVVDFQGGELETPTIQMRSLSEPDPGPIRRPISRKTEPTEVGGSNGPTEGN